MPTFKRSGVGTHPTISELTWDLLVCRDEGCDKDQGWPADLSIPVTAAETAVAGN